jgi:hypothetical protein
MRLVSRHRGLRGTKPGHSTGSSIFYQLALVSLVASIAALAHEMSRAYEEAAPAVQTPGVEAPAADEAAPEPTQLAQPDPNSVENAAQNQQPAFYVRAELDRPTRDFREGDSLHLKVVCEIDAYLYILYQQADGKVFQIFPNKLQPNNRVAAKQTVQVPADDDLFRWVVAPPFGKEVIKVLACRKPIEELSDAASRSKQFNRIEFSRVKQAAAELQQNPSSDWAEVDLEIFTYSKEGAPLAEGSKRFGVFFGVSKYRFHNEHRAAVQRLTNKDQGGLNLSACHLDALDLGSLLGQIGGLNQVKVFIDDEANRTNLEYVITRWLPSVTKPGDTVFIHFSGHGAQIPDDNGDEADQLDEVIIPSDFVDDLILSELVEEAKANQLDPVLKPRMEHLVDVYQRGGDRGREMLIRETAVSDDLFGRWLQHLSGRQVVVLLDTCHSGGFATQEKGIARQAADADGFDFLEGEMARLKDIGERDQAFLSAALAAEVARELITGKNGVFTGFLLESLRTAQGPVRLEDSYRYCVEQFPKYFELLNKARAEEGLEPVAAHRPFLVNYCSRPVFLKP